MRRLVGLWTGKAIQKATRLRGGGSALPGLVVEKVHPRFLAKTTSKLSQTILVTGTNGKTTTAKILRELLEAQGKRVIHNRAGSNMSRGIVSSLLDHSSATGKLHGTVAVFEVDEAWLPKIAEATQPVAVVVTNLVRDQLDRYGELDTTAKLIGEGLQFSQNAILNADDPLVAGLARFAKGAKVRYFGASAHLKAQLPDDASLHAKADAQHEQTTRTKPKLAVELTGATSRSGHQKLTFKIGRKTYKSDFPLDGVYNALNTAAALAAINTLSMNIEKALASLENIQPAYGRTELVEIDGKKLQLLLVKNPAGFNQVIKTFLVRGDSQPVLMALNDNIADGRDVSWVWDVDFEPLARYKHRIITTGTRGLDLSLRLKYAEVESTSELKLEKALNEFTHGLKPGQIGYVVPTYTAMLALRRILSKKVKLPEVWE